MQTGEGRKLCLPLQTHNLALQCPQIIGRAVLEQMSKSVWRGTALYTDGNILDLTLKATGPAKGDIKWTNMLHFCDFVGRLAEVF